MVAKILCEFLVRYSRYWITFSFQSAYFFLLCIFALKSGSTEQHCLYILVPKTVKHKYHRRNIVKSKNRNQILQKDLENTFLITLGFPYNIVLSTFASWSSVPTSYSDRPNTCSVFNSQAVCTAHVTGKNKSVLIKQVPKLKCA